MKVKQSIFGARLLAVFFVAVFLLMSVNDAEARKRSHHKRHHAHEIYVRPQPAAFVVDADTGEVIRSENADAPRYPASLTKMMTLYLTFEALAKNKLHLSDTISVSEHAASQPQTNIALQPGDRITVKDAILSIVVRSANDSAVALGEELGGSEEGFARKMTKKAHDLGMKRTAFRNASGLPDPGQRTTARDMATLGLALRRDFPQYFTMFKAEAFSFNGVNYITHNHVMMRYEGVDGIKTGYIRASGYNLVTSATRDNHHVIAAVLGGHTVRERDNKMIALLDKSFTEMAALPGGKRIQYASSGRIANAFAAKEEGYVEAEGEGDRPYVKLNRAASAASPRKAEPVRKVLTELPADTHWGIQIGAFPKAKDARRAAQNALNTAPAELKGATVTISDEAKSRTIHRSRLINITQDQAEAACHKLSKKRLPCFVYHVE